ncbi:hypothetical protein L1049_012628 [Liquidambar formosana]|uniref:CCHC-type domain-containing protein n=1 Tax=Liquidambar formosana TaxID=63359 RepID=A0AAP0N428_LIQFO
MDPTSGDLSLLISHTSSLSCSDEILTLVHDSSVAGIASSLMLVGKFVADRPLNIQAVRSTLLCAWKLSKAPSITFLSINIFLFGFALESNREKVFLSGPWSVRGAHLVLKEWSPGLVLEEISFKVSPFWVQIHGLPPGFKSLDNISKIGLSIGVFIEADVKRSNHLVWNNFLRVRVGIDVSAPLKTGFFLNRAPLPEVWIQFKYERLSDFCYRCGYLGHGLKDCSVEAGGGCGVAGNPSHGVSAFGPWLRASHGDFSRFSTVQFNSSQRSSRNTLGPTASVGPSRPPINSPSIPTLVTSPDTSTLPLDSTAPFSASSGLSIDFSLNPVVQLAPSLLDTSRPCPHP